ncbi:hypothetical protein O181_083522 [Austropuccinia psidii MF-1]|uniref:FAD/NAD(P)-binding domain-containing protein n=1 Tax=Austropuccinia psidii MF-1 TaxID=1389203 RepID=A0A9Q3IK63_9BASI|nr:hypothetical protein [Austropuccinia psidii MF-1]
MSTKDLYDFLVIGAGPAGVTAIAHLLDSGVSSIAWIDPHFLAGCLGGKYTQVPSNTKVKIFIDYVAQSPTLVKLIENAKKPNPFTILKAKTLDCGTSLNYVSDLFIFFTQELFFCHPEAICKFKGLVNSLHFSNENHWSAELRIEGLKDTRAVITKKVILATGSQPVRPANPIFPHIDLDIALSPTDLQKTLEVINLKEEKIAVIGSSHSAILVLKNLTDLSSELQIIHFYRSELRFAQYMEGWILYDNTGLKGVAADWARKVYPNLPSIRKIKLPNNLNEENRLYQRELQTCARVIYAIGFCPVELPKVWVDGAKKQVTFDHTTGNFNVPGMFGCGIAFPERVIDQAGNVEFAVGIYKFMKFLKRVGHYWI